MKIFLDDRREIPEGWTGARNSAEFKNLFERAAAEKIDIEAIAFDHDLGEFDETKNETSGYDLIKWLKENYPEYLTGKTEITCHSDDPDGRKNIEGYARWCRENAEELMASRKREYPFGEIEKR